MRRFVWLLCLALPLAWAASVPAWNGDWSVRVGAGPDGGSPPEVIDMRWARPYLDANATSASNATSAR